jgi:hypothetical protein
MSPLHRLIHLIILFSKIQFTGRVRKQSVKVRTPKSPPSVDDSPLGLATLHLFPHRARAEAQRVRRLA